MVARGKAKPAAKKVSKASRAPKPSAKKTPKISRPKAAKAAKVKSARAAAKPLKGAARAPARKAAPKPARKPAPAKSARAKPQKPIALYFWPTPNGLKISIMLEELRLPYDIHPINITKGEQFAPDFLKISPNNRMPAIVDPQGPGGRPVSIFESGAILQYLGDKSGKFYPADARKRVAVNEWLFWQVGGLGPMAGQAHHFRLFAKEKIPYAIERYTAEVARLYGVMDRRLAGQPFLAGAYSIADIASYPWVISHERQGQSLDDFPNLKRWFETIAARPAVQRGQKVGEALRQSAPLPPPTTPQPAPDAPKAEQAA